MLNIPGSKLGTHPHTHKKRAWLCRGLLAFARQNKKIYGHPPFCKLILYDVSRLA